MVKNCLEHPAAKALPRNGEAPDVSICAPGTDMEVGEIVGYHFLQISNFGEARLRPG